MVCLESPDKAQPKISKKKKKEKLNLSLNTDKSNDILENIENKYKNGTGTQHESSRKAKKKKQKRGITESVQTEISEIEANLIMGNHEHCEDGSGNPKRKKKKKRELIESSNSEIDEIITEKKSVGLEESEKLNKSTGKKRNRDSKQSSRCIDGSQATVTDENSDEKITRKSAKKSKKKKQKKETNNIQRDDENEPTSDERVIQESPELAAISCNDQTVTSPQELCTDINKKSKKSQKKKCLDNADVEVSTPEPPVKPKKSRKRKKMDSNDAGVKGEAQESTESCDMLPKKKHKKHTSEDDNVQSDQNSPSNDKPSKVKKKKSKKVEMSKEANTEDLPVDTKVEINEVADETPINACENTASVTKKRKKKSKHKEANSSQLPDPSSCKQNVEQKKKKSSSASPPSSKNDVSDTDRECSGTASSNNDESELQHDARSKPKKHKKSKPAKDVQNADTDCTKETVEDDLGQWKTAELSSSAHEKFARLLGARKKRFKPVVTPLSDLKAGESVLSKLTGVWKPPPERTLFGSLLSREKKFAKMAMDQKETAKLNESLETQYNKTLEFNLQKRKEGNAAKGLGFQEDPAKGKKHYIDIHKVKSIELD